MTPTQKLEAIRKHLAEDEFSADSSEIIQEILDNDEDEPQLTREEMEEHDDTPSLQDEGKELGSYGS